jgi:hypothetical protein
LFFLPFITLHVVDVYFLIAMLADKVRITLAIFSYYDRSIAGWADSMIRCYSHIVFLPRAGEAWGHAGTGHE